jgi:hypothetical protein
MSESDSTATARSAASTSSSSTSAHRAADVGADEVAVDSHGASPFFNSLPVMRDGLLDAGPAREYVMQFVSIPELTATMSNQRYEPMGQRIVRYSSGSFEAAIVFDADGFVEHYSGFLERVS